MFRLLSFLQSSSEESRDVTVYSLWSADYTGFVVRRLSRDFSVEDGRKIVSTRQGTTLINTGLIWKKVLWKTKKTLLDYYKTFFPLGLFKDNTIFLQP